MWEVLDQFFAQAEPTDGPSSRCVIESLEGRTMMSGTSPMDWDANFMGDQSAASSVVVGVSHVSAQSTNSGCTLVPNCVGNWSGTYAVNGNRGSGTMTVNITQQNKSSITGTFNLPMMGGRYVSTMQIGTDHTIRGMVRANSMQFSVTAAVSTNGRYITGRWSLQPSRGPMQTGTFTITRP